MDIVSILIWLVFGAVAGFVANFIMGKNGMGLIGNIIIGIVGSFVGGWLANFFRIGGATGGISVVGFIVAVVGACVLIFVVNLIKKAMK